MRRLFSTRWKPSLARERFLFFSKQFPNKHFGNFISRFAIKLDFITHALGVYPIISCETTTEKEKFEVLFLVVFYAPTTTRVKEREKKDEG